MQIVTLVVPQGVSLQVILTLIKQLPILIKKDVKENVSGFSITTFQWFYLSACDLTDKYRSRQKFLNYYVGPNWCMTDCKILVLVLPYFFVCTDLHIRLM